MTGKVISLATGVDNREYSSAVLDTVDELHDLAASGEITGIAYAVLYADGSTSAMFQGKVTTALVGAIAVGKQNVTDALLRGDD